MRCNVWYSFKLFEFRHISSKEGEGKIDLMTIGKVTEKGEASYRKKQLEGIKDMLQECKMLKKVINCYTMSVNYTDSGKNLAIIFLIA